MTDLSKKHYNNNKSSNNDAIWRVLKFIVIAGLLMIMAVAATIFIKGRDSNVSYTSFEYLMYYLNTVGLFIMLAGASFMGGGLTGFLFGIPKLISSNSPLNGDDSQTRVIHNATD